MQSPTMVWHYAPWAYLRDILDAGRLMPGPAGSDGERSMVWFSRRQDWEPTATKGWAMPDGSRRQMTLAEQRERVGCIRFGLPVGDARLLAWPDACRAAGMGFTGRRKAEAAGRRLGANPVDWLGVAESLPLVGLRFQVWAERWGDADMSPMALRWEALRGDR